MSKWMLMAVLAAGVGVTGCGGGARGERAEKMIALRVEDALDELDATQAQRERVQAMTKDSVATAKPLLEQARTARAALVAEWRAERPDANRVHQLVDGQLDALRGFTHSLVDKGLELHQLLTSEQRAEVTARLERFEKHSKR
ncbi:MAG: Spy/CpxP family protein refolding chaperone [Myxococcaceae bacterium]|nr:Spy/CpxP family protein refolding chaperone [Myxococcaceae bacterium]